LALLVLEALGPAGSSAQAKRNTVAAIKSVSQKLGNRPAACRKYYVHPAVLDSYAQGQLWRLVAQMLRKESAHGLRREERAILRLLALDRSARGKTLAP